MKNGPTDSERGRLIREILKQRILVVDGAMGTMIQALSLEAEDFGGAQYEGCNEHLNLTRPEAIAGIHRQYLEAGADIIETNTFGATRIVLAEYGLQDKAREINIAAAKIAQDAARGFEGRFVAGAMGPTTKTISVTGGVTFDALVEAYREQASGLLAGGVDVLLLETAQDTLNLKAGLVGIEQAISERGEKVPVMVSATIEVMGTMLAGQGVEALAISLENHDLLSLGLNCATGPDFMTDHVRTLAAVSPFAVSCIPNAGLPDENGKYHEGPAQIAAKLAGFADEGWVNIVGGCCGTTPDHIRMLAQAVAGKKPHHPSPITRSAVSGLEPFVIEIDRRPVLVGERTNVIGSRLFKEMIVKGGFEEAAEVGRRQVRNGAQILDVCLANPDRDERADMLAFLDQLTKKVKVPLMIDSTDAFVIEQALKKTPGKSIINSINLEDGEERFAKVVPLARRYGAAVVVGTIDEDKAQGMAVTAERKLAIARRSFDLLTHKYGLKAEDLIFDALVFPCGTGDKNYIGSAAQTIAGVRLIKETFPLSRTVLGISNVSFGLPTAGREILNAVFLHHCVEAGLDLAIVNAEKLARFTSIPENERQLCEDLLFWKGPGDPDYPKGLDPVAAFTEHFRERKAAETVDGRSKLPIEERLARNVVEGSKEGLLEDLQTLSLSKRPLDIINGPLMKGMDVVGRLFAANEMIVAEVLQSAEVMKAAVAFLEPHMEKADIGSKGKLMLATVKGDVHDIGKNLVHIILKNNGYEIVDLGIKVAPETLIEAARRERPTLIGLSGLLVKSAQQMVVTAEDLKTAGITQPVLVGGAALSPRFAAARIAPAYGEPVVYAKDAMHGLEIANSLADPRRREAFLKKNRELQDSLKKAAAAAMQAAAELPATTPSKLTYNHVIPAPPDLKKHSLEDFELDAVFGYLNPIMLYGKHLGLRGNVERLVADRDPRALELMERVRALQAEVVEKGLVRARAVYRFFAAQSEGNKVFLYDTPHAKAPAAVFDFPRQKGGEGLCIADYVLPKSMGMDYVALFVVTCGQGVMEHAARLREEGQYLKSHALQALAIESAEAFAELLHERIRAMWGVGDPPSMTLREKFQARYRGLRVSFGYPACPNLEDQRVLFGLLKPETIGVKLTEGLMMEPEASVSALVFHHPEAKYFSVGETPLPSGERGGLP